MYPYQHKSPDDLPGEYWKPVDGFIDYYEVSNMGRVRSLDRVIPHPRLGSQFVKGRILSQSIARNKNIKTGEPMIDLRVSLTKENKPYYFNVRRLVYNAFASPIDYASDGQYVINLDTDGFNNCVENLALVTKAEKSRRVFDRDRIDSYLKTADRTGRKLHGGATQRKPVIQQDVNEKVLRQFESITEASLQTGTGEKEIIMVAKGRWKQYKGFVWRYADAADSG